MIIVLKRRADNALSRPDASAAVPADPKDSPALPGLRFDFFEDCLQNARAAPVRHGAADHLWGVQSPPHCAGPKEIRDQVCDKHDGGGGEHGRERFVFLRKVRRAHRVFAQGLK